MSKRNILLMASTVILCSSCIEIPNDTVKQYISNTDIIYFYLLIVGLCLNDEFRWHVLDDLPMDFDDKMGYLGGFVVSPFCGYLMATYTHFMEDEVISYIIGYIVSFCIISYVVGRYIREIEKDNLGHYSLPVCAIANWMTYVPIALGIYHIYTFIASKV